MKKHYPWNPLHMLWMISLLLWTTSANLSLAQCTFTSTYGTRTVGPNVNDFATIPDSWAGEVSTWDGIQAAHTYATTSSVSTDYFTVRSGSNTGPVVANGVQPLVWSSSLAGTYYIVLNTNAACGTENIDRAITTTNNGPSAACANPTAAGTTTSSTNNACPNQSFTLGLTGNSTGSGITYQWQSSPDNVTYSPIAGAISQSYSTTQTAPTYYRCVATCAAGTPSTSVAKLVGQNSFINCYCTSNATSALDTDLGGVHIGTLSNVSTCSTTGGAGSTPQQYSDYTALPAPNLARSA
ncbi:MAG: hypothetical protein KJ941_12110, partial [Bacteroidetes bacterium]|nr:hypothetical protein [Bacteroidota bacterium]